ncbi:class I SAM-dependent methyltransferase [Agromyces allii]|uniref:Methyltransferase type 12 domain-containing protein n=1 Tax=Agromyces allii TaxID=393607 RepID=A0ABN2Q2J4_9MICO|nr:class I SAM-dependent methyltransferase [Agromyces allii]
MSPSDLEWFIRRMTNPAMPWTCAKTYAQSAPHEYVVHPRTPGLTREGFQRAAHVIHTFGEPGRFWRSTNTYLVVGPHRYWTMDADLDDTDLINRAVNDRVYGVQDAPRTFHGGWVEHDALGTTYDAAQTARRTPADDDFDQALIDAVRSEFGARPPRTLDIGCGTGRVLDLGLTTPGRYTGIDPSQAMLNALVRKHPGVRRLIPARFEDVPRTLLAPDYDLVLAVDTGLTPDQIERVEAIPSGLTIVV